MIGQHEIEVPAESFELSALFLLALNLKFHLYQLSLNGENR